MREFRSPIKWERLSFDAEDRLCKERGWKQRDKGACCDWDTFWFSFAEYWAEKHPDMKQAPDFIVQKAHYYWSRYAMTGWEGFRTVESWLANQAT